MRPQSLARTILQPLVIAVVLALAVRSAVHIYTIPSASMEPTLDVGDRIMVTRYVGGDPERGHVIVFRSRGSEEELLVKRVIGVPGDLVDTRLGRVRIGGYTLPEPYVLRQASSGAIESQVVPADCYFVLGDNRDDSLDSRSWGFVPRSSVVGRVRVVLWSSPPSGDDRVAAAETPGASSRTVRRPSGLRLFKWID